MEIKPNNIYKGDCYELIKQVADKSIDLVYTDIPYLYKGGGAGQGSNIAKRIGKIQNKEIKSITNGINYSIFDEYIRVLKHIYIYIWCSKEQIKDILNYFTSIPNRKVNYNILVWCKTNPVPATNGVLLPDLEYCLLFKEVGSPRFNDGYELKSKWFMSAINKADKDDYNHPTIKPLELVERHILHSTQPNDIVLDTFLGSGTTAVACKNTGRKYIGFEIDDNYFKIAQDRLDGINQKGEMNLFDIVYEEGKIEL